MIDVIVAEPNSMLRLGIRAVLETHAGLAIAAEVSDAEQLCARFLDVRHDVLVVELGVLKRIGRAALRELRSARPASRILVHSYEFESDFGAEAFKFGATGYVANDCSQADLCDAVVRVAAGLPYITRALGEQLATTVCFRASNLPYVSLTEREAEVFKMLAVGLKLRDIAVQLGKSTDAISACKMRIMAKMEMPGSSDLVRHAISQSLASGPRPTATAQELRVAL